MYKWSQISGFVAIAFLVVGLLFSFQEKSDEIPREGTLIYHLRQQDLSFDIPVHYYIPARDVNMTTCQIVMHGASRNATEYLDGWREKADAYGLILLAPEFSKKDFSISAYNQGMPVHSKGFNYLNSYHLFQLIDDLFVFANQELKLDKGQYHLYGHSAGGQFVHRFLLFHDSPYVGKAVAANPGWYTYPTEMDSFPYGVAGMFSSTEERKAAFYEKELTLLLGDADTLRQGALRMTPEADAQGMHRLERGLTYYENNKAEARRLGFEFHWNKVLVPGAGHEHELMSPAAADVIYGEN